MKRMNNNLKELLGIKTNIPKMDWYSYSGIIASPPKFGKTTIAGLIPNSILLACEKGFDSIEIDYKSINSWEDFIDFIDLLEENIDEIGEELKVITVDTVHELWRMCNQYVLNRINLRLRSNGGRGVETLAQYDYRNGLVIRDEEFIKQKTRLENLGLKPIWFAHLVKKKIKPEDGESYNSLELDFDDNLYNILVKEVSYVLIGENVRVLNADGKTSHVDRKFIAKNDGVIQGGSRVHIGDDIEFKTEQEFLDKFNEVFSQSLRDKNNISKEDAEKMITTQNKEIVEERKKIKTDKEAATELVKEIRDAVKAKPEVKKKVLGYLEDNYETNSPQILNTLELVELEKVAKLLK